MLKKTLMGAILLPFLAMPALAQDRETDHHYQGGPKTEVPHHVGKRAQGKTTPTPSQAGQHHYQGGPGAIHHVGDMPKAAGDAPKKAKRKKKSA